MGTALLCEEVAGASAATAATAITLDSAHAHTPPTITVFQPSSWIALRLRVAAVGAFFFPHCNLGGAVHSLPWRCLPSRSSVPHFQARFAFS